MGGDCEIAVCNMSFLGLGLGVWSVGVGVLDFVTLHKSVFLGQT